MATDYRDIFGLGPDSARTFSINNRAYRARMAWAEFLQNFRGDLRTLKADTALAILLRLNATRAILDGIEAELARRPDFKALDSRARQNRHH